MRKKIVLRPYGQNTQYLPGVYHTADQQVRVLLSDTDFKEMSQMEYETSKPKIKDLLFDRKTHPTYEFSYEGDEKLQLPIDKKIERLISVYFAEHPQVYVNDNPTSYSKVKNFNLESLEDKVKQTYSKWDMKRRVVQEIYEMGEKKIEEVAYYYGLTPSGKSVQELTLALADFNTGVCVQDSVVSSFMETWALGTNRDRDFVVNASRAIKFGVIANQLKDRKDNYYYGQEFVGTSFNDVLGYCKREERIYKEIVRETNDRDQKIKDDAFKKQQAPPGFVPLKTTSEIIELKTLKDTAQELKKEGFIKKETPIQFFERDKLIEVITEAEKVKAAQNKPAEVKAAETTTTS